MPVLPSPGVVATQNGFGCDLVLVSRNLAEDSKKCIRFVSISQAVSGQTLQAGDPFSDVYWVKAVISRPRCGGLHLLRTGAPK